VKTHPEVSLVPPFRTETVVHRYGNAEGDWKSAVRCAGLTQSITDGAVGQ
jgi:hypothetical protein